MAESKPKSKIQISSKLHESLQYTIRSISKSDPLKGLLLILNKINGSNANEAVSFVNANCSVSRFLDVFPMASIYRTGLDTLNDYLENGKEPENEDYWSALKSLIDFVEGMEKMELAKRLSKQNWNEADVSIILLHHFLSKLKSKQEDQNPPYILDKYCKKQTYLCPCCLERLTGQFEDTSIGNTEVWHGRIDAIIGDEISITNIEVSGDDNASDQSDASSDSSFSDIVEVKKGSVSKEKVVHQILAQTITFSFLQNSKHPDQVPLYPNISISKNMVQFHFYDSVNDILLESQEYEMFDYKICLNLRVILALWLVVNHSLFCTGVTQTMKDLSIKAEFLKGQDHIKEIYKTKLDYHCGSGKQTEFRVMNFLLENYHTDMLRYHPDCPPAKKPKLETSSLGDGDKSV